MTSKDVFSSAVRIIGLWYASQGAIYFLARVVVLVSALHAHLPVSDILSTFAGGIAEALIGAWILLKAESIVRLIYGTRPFSAPRQS